MRIHRMKSILSLLLAVTLLVSSVCLASCGETNESAGTEAGTDTGAEAETDAPSVYEQLEKENWDGRTFSILCRNEAWNTYLRNFLVEELGAEGNSLLDDNVYERNRVVAHDLNIVIEPIFGGDYSTVNAAVVSQSSSGTDDYDAIVGHLFTYTTCAVNKNLRNLADIPTLDLSSVWWDAECTANLSAYGYVPLTCGDILPGSMTMSACVVFNKRLANEMNKTAPYDAVKQGTWTLDMLNEATADVTFDLNGDGKIKPEDDLYGMAAYCISASFAQFYGCGIRFITVDADGVPTVDFDHDKATEVYDKLYKGLITQQSYFVTDGESSQNEDVFINGHALYLDCQLNTLTRLSSGMTDDYGILPEPKYDSLQKEYYSFINGDTPLIGVIASETTPEFSGAVLEAMGAYNHAVITPLLFEIVTKYRNARDPESAAMVDVIIAHRVFDFAYFYNMDLGWLVANSLKAKRTSIASTMKSSERTTTNQLKSIVRKWTR